MIYLDNAASTQMDERVKAAMDEWNGFANPSSIHKLGIEARSKIEEARRSVAELINCSPEQIIFTSGGSESNAMVVRGYRDLYYGWQDPVSVAYSVVEHESVIENAKLSGFTQNGRPPVEIPVCKNGKVSYFTLEEVLAANKHIHLVSVMAVNNETGSINDIKSMSFLAHCHNAVLHTDCVQAVGTIPLDVQAMQCDFLSLSAHKFHGPRGVGVLYCKDKTQLIPLIKGSDSQESGFRGGTENVPSIIGLGVAAKIAKEEYVEDAKKIAYVKSKFYFRLIEQLNQRGYRELVHFNDADGVPVGKIFSITIDGIDAQSMVLMLSAKGICVSAGSACNSSSTESSHVLKAIGLTDEQAHSTIRVSFSKYNSEFEAEAAADAIVDVIHNHYHPFSGVHIWD